MSNLWETFKLVESKNIGACLWLNRWVGEYKGEELTLDATITHMGSEFYEEINIFPDKYNWLIGPDFPKDDFLPAVSDVAKLGCLAQKALYYQAESEYLGTVEE